MGLRVSLASEFFSVEPGVAASVALEVHNDGTAPIKVEVQVEGLDPEWVAVPVPVIEVPGGESVTERMFLKPPREPESLAGTYPFVVKAKSAETGEERLLPSSLEVKPFHNVSVDVQPRRGFVSPLSRTRQTTFQVTVMNLGNVEHTVKLSANDHEELFSFEFDVEDLTVAPGAQRTVSVTATAVKPALIANARLQQFTVSCRSLDNKTVATATHGQIEQRALVTPGMLGLALLGVIILTAFVILLPKAPSVDIFTVSPERVYLGEGYTVTWSASNARSVTLVVDGQVYTDLSPRGSRGFTAIAEEGVIDKQITIQVTAFSGRRQSDPKNKLLIAREEPKTPEPEILEFSISKTDLNVGEYFQVSYKLGVSVTEAILQPIGQVLDPKLDGIQLVAQVEGVFDYRLIARNEAGQTAEATVKVTIKKGSKANIVVFRADPPVVDPLNGRVTLTWQVNNHYRIEIVENGRVGPGFNESQGTIDRVITQDTTFKLVVYDDEGVPTEKEVTVKTGIIDSMYSGFDFAGITGGNRS
jgi:hypothetical protein